MTDKNFSNLINGKMVAADETFDVINPATEEAFAKSPRASKADLDTTVAAAQEAFKTWRKTSHDERKAVLLKIAGILNENIDDLARLLTHEQGKPIAAATSEVGASTFWCTAVAEQEVPTDVLEDTDAHRVEVRHDPVGVVGGIVPWNYPILMSFWKIAPALITGNTIIIKTSPYTPISMLAVAELVKDAAPAGVLNIISGGDELGQWMTEHEGINKISFTGSTPTGRKVAASSATNLKRVTLELGGNDAAIVLPDVDPKAKAKELFWASFANSGQVCIASKRLYIHEDIYDEFKEEFVKTATSVKVGDGSEQGTDLGPVQNKMQFDKVSNLLADTKAKGYNILCGGEIEDKPGYFIPITVVDNPPEDSRIVREEPFGPILPLLKWKDRDDVIARANDSEFGLGGSVWSNDIDAALEIAGELDTGSVWINEAQAVGPHIPFGGHKQSGVGVQHGAEGLLEFTNAKAITVKKG
ncbi:MAG: aldehyde dehydrogenase family protein [Alphaproteobacteria bacterium]|nr:MAG: aldehyde dehydrogenase family protein [Alphaproteobacteria bacterium]